MNLLEYNYGITSALRFAIQAKRSERGTIAALENIQHKRFAKLLTHSRKYSPFYQRLYNKLPSDLSINHLDSLPIVTKAEIMENFDEVLTDRAINKEAVLRFAENPENLGSPFNGKYFIARTSGTTGLVGHYVHDLFSYFLINILTAVRSKGLKPYSLVSKRLPFPSRIRIASLLSPSANLGVASVMASAPKWVRAMVEFKLLDILEQWDTTIEVLNRFQPDIIGSFPTILEQLAESQLNGELCIRPQTVRSGGEMLMPRIRKIISEAFHSEVFDCYGCAETGWVGMECDEQNGIHIFSDWFIVEPVDKDGHRVPNGIESHKILITNLANYVQPFIRFELPDRITVLEGECPCGSILPRILLKGRTSELLSITGNDGKEVIIPPFHLTTLAEMVPGIYRYQIIQEDDNHLTVLFTARDGIAPDSVYAVLKSSFEAYLKKSGLLPFVGLTISQTNIIQRDPSGKIRQVFSRVK